MVRLGWHGWQDLASQAQTFCGYQTGPVAGYKIHTTILRHWAVYDQDPGRTSEAIKPNIGGAIGSRLRRTRLQDLSQAKAWAQT